MFSTLAPWFFVLIWSTGLVAARAVVPHASTELFLLVRLLLSAGLLGVLAFAARESWPRGRQLAMHLLAGALLHGVYLSAAYWTVAHGMPAGVMSLIGSMQPIVTVVAMFLIYGERPSMRTVAGLGIAIAGVVCVLAPALGATTGGEHFGVWAIVVAVIAVTGMTAGTMIQRGRLAGDGVRVSASVQNAGGALVALAGMLVGGGYQWDHSPTLWIGLIWSVVGLSVGAVLLLVWMVRIHGATKMSTLLLAVPALAAGEAWILFGEKLGAIQMLGFVLALAGVVLARRVATPSPPKKEQPVAQREFMENMK
ncbi:DMT family transporter [Paraburkholderia edwinii]|uniref:DMT family transporter n=1 Tax=Paraburkholderia edwinii TaxID=2861782 RepID=A0ABX8UWN5_9BURK|nr:DMT family transporter [Paraburkholderia edwinii]QYD73051.1 DMT family transporter [Paraburkholderia edwinii]